MKNKKRIILSAIALILISAIAVCGFTGYLRISRQRAKITDSFDSVILKFKDLIPDETTAVVEREKTSSMPSLQIDGEDYVAILDCPKFGRTFPIFATFDDSFTAAKLPARYYGSAGNGSLVIGGSKAKGQFDFLTEIDAGDVFKLTNATGNVFTYSVVKVQHLKTSDYDLVYSPDYDCSVFVKNGFSQLLVVRLKYGMN